MDDLLNDLLRICGFGLNNELPEFRLACQRLSRELSSEYRAGYTQGVEEGQERANVR